MDWTNRRERFRATLGRGRCIHPASVYDPISARIAEDIGFEAGMLAGSVASLAVLGAPDIVLLTLTEFAAQAYRVNRAGNLPLLVKNGFSGPIYATSATIDLSHATLLDTAHIQEKDVEFLNKRRRSARNAVGQGQPGYQAAGHVKTHAQPRIRTTRRRETG